MANPTSYLESLAAQFVARTPEEKAYDESVEYTPEMLQKLDEAIAEQKDPKLKAVLQQERVQLVANINKRQMATASTSSVKPVSHPMTQPPVPVGDTAATGAPKVGPDFMTKMQSFMSMDPKELTKKYPEIDPGKLLDQLQAGQMGLQTQGQQFAGGPTPDQGMLQGVPGAMPQGGQGFQMNTPGPWTPQPTATEPFAGVGADPGFKIAEGGAMGGGAAVGGINPAMLSSLMGGMGKMGQQQQPQATPPVTPAVRPPGGANAKLTIALPGVQQMTEQMLQQLLKRSVYG